MLKRKRALTADNDNAAGEPRASVMPREHGAWVLLYGPLALGAAAGGTHYVLDLLLLVGASTGFFIAQHGIRAWLVSRGKTQMLRGAILWTLTGLICGAALLARMRSPTLAAIGLIAGALCAVMVALSRRPVRKRFERTIRGEAAAVLGLSLTGPAAVLVARGSDTLAACVYFDSVLFFLGGVLSVEAILAGVRQFPMETLRSRFQVMWMVVADHILLLIAAALLWARNPAGIAALIAVVPAILRVCWDWRRLGEMPKSLRRIGVRETLIAVWFVVFSAAALHR